MAEVSSNIPEYGIPIIGPNGQVNDIWWRFFVTLFDRTGTNEGGDITEILIQLSKQSTEIQDVTHNVDGNQAAVLIALIASRMQAMQAKVDSLSQVFARPASTLNVDMPMDRYSDPKSLRKTNADASFGYTPAHMQETDQTLHALVTQTNNGFMSAADKVKLDAISSIFAPTAITADVTAANTTADVPILSVTLPANSLVVGSTFGAALYAIVSSAALTGNINIWLKINTTKVLTLMLTTPALGSTAQGISFYPRLTVRTTGASGTIQTSGLFTSNNNVYNGGPVVNSALGSIDTTVANTLTIGVNWSVANAGNTLAVKNCDISQVK